MGSFATPMVTEDLSNDDLLQIFRWYKFYSFSSLFVRTFAAFNIK